MELLKDNDVIQYQLGKDNVVANALNGKAISRRSLACLRQKGCTLSKEILTLVM